MSRASEEIIFRVKQHLPPDQYIAFLERSLLSLPDESIIDSLEQEQSHLNSNPETNTSEICQSSLLHKYESLSNQYELLHTKTQNFQHQATEDCDTLLLVNTQLNQAIEALRTHTFRLAFATSYFITTTQYISHEQKTQEKLFHSLIRMFEGAVQRYQIQQQQQQQQQPQEQLLIKQQPESTAVHDSRSSQQQESQQKSPSPPFQYRRPPSPHQSLARPRSSDDLLPSATALQTLDTFSVPNSHEDSLSYQQQQQQQQHSEQHQQHGHVSSPHLHDDPGVLAQIEVQKLAVSQITSRLQTAATLQQQQTDELVQLLFTLSDPSTAFSISPAQMAICPSSSEQFAILRQAVEFVQQHNTQLIQHIIAQQSVLTPHDNNISSISTSTLSLPIQTPLPQQQQQQQSTTINNSNITQPPPVDSGVLLSPLPPPIVDHMPSNDGASPLSPETALQPPTGSNIPFPNLNTLSQFVSGLVSTWWSPSPDDLRNPRELLDAVYEPGNDNSYLENCQVKISAEGIDQSKDSLQHIDIPTQSVAPSHISTHTPVSNRHHHHPPLGDSPHRRSPSHRRRSSIISATASITKDGDSPTHGGGPVALSDDGGGGPSRLYPGSSKKVSHTTNTQVVSVVAQDQLDLYNDEYNTPSHKHSVSHHGGNVVLGESAASATTPLHIATTPALSFGTNRDRLALYDDRATAMTIGGGVGGGQTPSIASYISSTGAAHQHDAMLFEDALHRILDTMGPSALYRYISPELANELYFHHNMNKLRQKGLSEEERARILQLTSQLVIERVSSVGKTTSASTATVPMAFGSSNALSQSHHQQRNSLISDKNSGVDFFSELLDDIIVPIDTHQHIQQQSDISYAHPISSPRNSSSGGFSRRGIIPTDMSVRHNQDLNGDGNDDDIDGSIKLRSNLSHISGDECNDFRSIEIRAPENAMRLLAGGESFMMQKPCIQLQRTNSFDQSIDKMSNHAFDIVTSQNIQQQQQQQSSSSQQPQQQLPQQSQQHDPNLEIAFDETHSIPGTDHRFAAALPISYKALRHIDQLQSKCREQLKTVGLATPIAANATAQPTSQQQQQQQQQSPNDVSLQADHALIRRHLALSQMSTSSLSKPGGIGYSIEQYHRIRHQALALAAAEASLAAFEFNQQISSASAAAQNTQHLQAQHPEHATILHHHHHSFHHQDDSTSTAIASSPVTIPSSDNISSQITSSTPHPHSNNQPQQQPPHDTLDPNGFVSNLASTQPTTLPSTVTSAIQTIASSPTTKPTQTQTTSVALPGATPTPSAMPVYMLPPLNIQPRPHHLKHPSFVPQPAIVPNISSTAPIDEQFVQQQTQLSLLERMILEQQQHLHVKQAVLAAAAGESSLPFAQTSAPLLDASAGAGSSSPAQFPSPSQEQHHPQHTTIPTSSPPIPSSFFPSSSSTSSPSTTPQLAAAAMNPSLSNHHPHHPPVSSSTHQSLHNHPSPSPSYPLYPSTEQQFLDSPMRSIDDHQHIDIPEHNLLFRVKLKMKEHQDARRKFECERMLVRSYAEQVMENFVRRSPMHQDNFLTSFETFKSALGPEERASYEQDDELVRQLYESKFRHDLDQELSQGLRDKLFSVIRNPDRSPASKEQAAYILKRRLGLKHEPDGTVQSYKVPDNEFLSPYADQQAFDEIDRIIQRRDERLKREAAVEWQTQREAGKQIFSNILDYFVSPFGR